jgi:predicted nucleic acid-binding protein
MMSIVVDSNLVAAIILPLPYSDAARNAIAGWKRAGDVVMGPVLLEYEFTTILRRAQFHGLMDFDQAAFALQRMTDLHIQSMAPSEILHRRALEWAERLGQSRACDAQYLALAEQESAELWTGDKKLVTSTAGMGVDWVHWVGEG